MKQRTVEEWLALYMLAIDGQRNAATGPFVNWGPAHLDEFLNVIWSDLAGHPISRDFRWKYNRHSVDYPKIDRWIELWCLNSKELADAMLVPPEEAPADEKAIAARSRPA